MNKTWSYKWVTIVIVMVSTFCWVQVTKAGEISSVPEGHDFTVVAADAPYKQGELLVRFAPNADGKQRNFAEKNQVLSLLGGGTIKKSFKIVPGLTLVKLPTGLTVKDALKTFNKTDGILYTEPNYKIYLASTTPNDTRFDDLWGMHNTGQTGGMEDADTNGNGYVSMLEAFNYAAGNDHLSEIPQYDDNGDGLSHTDPVPAGGDGTLGCTTYLTDVLVGNVDGDNDVDFGDYPTLAAYWMETECEGCGGIDFNCDTNVDFIDLREFIANWLADI